MAAKKPKKRDDGSGFSAVTWVLGGVAVLAIAIIGYSLGTRTFGSTVRAPVELDVSSDQELVELAQGVVAGDPDAGVTIVEFGDFQCPGCGSFARTVKPLVDQRLVDRGEATFVFYDFPLVRIHGNAFLAARAARCAGDQGRFWDYHDLLFQNQGQWSADASPESRFDSYAERLGLDMDTFESCLRSDRHAETVTANMRLGEALGVSGTPTIMVSQGQGMANRLSNYNFEAIQAAVEEARGGTPVDGSPDAGDGAGSGAGDAATSDGGGDS